MIWWERWRYRSGDPAARRGAVERLGRDPSPAAVPPLVRALRDWDARVREEAVRALRGRGWRAATVEEGILEAIAGRDFRAAARAGAPAVPLLLSVVRGADGDLAPAAVDALADLADPGAIPLLEEAARRASDPAVVREGPDADPPEVRRAVVRAAEVGLSALAQRDPSPFLRALGEGPLSAPATRALSECRSPALASSLADLLPRSFPRDGEVTEFLKMQGEAAVGVLVPLLCHREVRVRWRAREALEGAYRGWASTPAARGAVGGLVVALADADGDVRRDAAAILHAIDPGWANGDAAAARVADLERVLESGGEPARVAAVGVLASLGRGAGVPALLRAAVHPDPPLRSSARAALDRADPAWPGSGAAAEAVSGWMRCLDGPRPDVREAAADLLARVAPDGAIAGLLPRLLAADGAARGEAAKLLHRLDPEWRRSPALAAFLPRAWDALGGPDPLAREAAVPALDEATPGWERAPEARSAAASLLAELAHPEGGRRSDAAAIVARVGPPGALPALAALLSDADERVVARAEVGVRGLPGWPEDPDLRARVAVVRRDREVLVELGSAAVPSLLAAAARPASRGGPADSWASEVLGVLPLSAAAALAGAARGHGEARARASALQALADIGAPEASRIAAAALTDSDPGVRRRAVRVLGETPAVLGTPESQDRLLSHLEAAAADRGECAAALQALRVQGGEARALSHAVGLAAGMTTTDWGSLASFLDASLGRCGKDVDTVLLVQAAALGDLEIEVEETNNCGFRLGTRVEVLADYAAARQRARQELVRRGSSALAPATRAPDPDLRAWAAGALAGTDGPEAAPALAAAARDADPRVRRAAVAALGRRTPAEAAAALVVATGDADESVRLAALEGLGRLADPGTFPELAGAARSPSEATRRAALRALGASGFPEALPALERALAEGTEGERVDAARALGSIRDGRGLEALGKVQRGASAAVAAAVDEARAAQGDPDGVKAVLERMRAGGAGGDALAAVLVRAGAAAIPALVEAQATPASPVRDRAFAVMRQILATSPLVPQAVVDGLGHSNPGVRERAYLLLVGAGWAPSTAPERAAWAATRGLWEAAGKEGEEAVPFLRRLLGATGANRAGIATALGWTGLPEAAEAVVSALREGGDAPFREAAAAALSGMASRGLPEAAARAVVVRALVDREPLVRAAAADALARAHWEPGDASERVALCVARGEYAAAAREGAEAVGPLCRVLLEGRGAAADECAAANALGELGDPDAVPALERALRERAYEVRRAAAAALGRVRGEAAVATLLQAGIHQAWEVRESVTSALAVAAGRDPLAVAAHIAAPRRAQRLAAVNALRQAGWDPEDVASRVLLRVASERVGEAVEMGAAAVPDLARLAADETLPSDVRLGAGGALARLEPARLSDVAAPLLLSAAVERPWEPVDGREAALEAVREVARAGGVDPEWVPSAAAALDWDTRDVDKSGRHTSLVPDLSRGDAAVDRLCRVQHPFSTAVLKKVARLADLTVSLPTCGYTTDYQVGFDARRRSAREELRRRGEDF